MEVILYSKECNWYTSCCPLNGGVSYRERPLREAILYMYMYTFLKANFLQLQFKINTLTCTSIHTHTLSYTLIICLSICSVHAFDSHIQRYHVSFE